MKNWLKNSWVIITGASSGIGREIAKTLLINYDVKVIGVGRAATKMISFTEELPIERRKNFIYRLFDVGDKDAWIAFKNELDELAINPVLIINNAGVFPNFSRFENMGSDCVERTLKINLFSAVYAAEIFLPQLKGRGGILNVSSSAALCPVVGTTAYSASKGALKSFTEALSLEYGKDTYIGIVFPGTTATSLFDGNKALVGSGMLNKFAMPSKKMAKKIIKTVLRRKRRKVFGFDAKLMCFLAKVAPVKGPRLMRWFLKKFGANYFEGVFNK